MSGIARLATPCKRRRMLCVRRANLIRQGKMHDATTERLQPPNDDLQVQIAKLMHALECNRTATEGAAAVDTHIQPAVKTLLSLARKLRP